MVCLLLPLLLPSCPPPTTAHYSSSMNSGGSKESTYAVFPSTSFGCASSITDDRRMSKSVCLIAIAIAITWTSLLVWQRGSSSFGVWRYEQTQQRTSSSSSANAEGNWVFQIGKHEWKKYSQNEEDGVIDFLFSHISNPIKYFVEFGVEAGLECNTRYLFEERKWSGLLMDGSNEDPSRFLHKELIYEHNIVSLFEKYKVPKAFGLLVVDTDLYDYYILNKILEAGYSPQVIVVEVNSSIAPGKCWSVKKIAGFDWWDKTNYFGASVTAFHHLGDKFDYSMVYCEKTGVNCFMVRNDLIPGGSKRDVLTPAVLQKYPMYLISDLNNINLGHPADPQKREFAEVCKE